MPTEARPFGGAGELPLPPGCAPAPESGHEILGDRPGLRDITGPIEIGLVNNMPDAALEATERQFLSLLACGGAGIDVRVHFFTLADVPRGERAERHLALCYDDLDALLKSHLDAVIITGNEPRAARLSDEPYWHSLTRLFEWAEENTLSALFSCLSAHATVLHFDGIERIRHGRKCSGLFDHVVDNDHPLTTGLAGPWPVAHSRWNGLPEAALRAAGYRILSRSEAVGVNLFVRQRSSLFVLFQGHPEYEPDSLLKEYRRDVGRFLAGEQADYPEIPEGCLTPAATHALLRFRERALTRPAADLAAAFPVTIPLQQARPRRARSGATAVFANWLQAIAQAKQRRWRTALVPLAFS